MNPDDRCWRSVLRRCDMMRDFNPLEDESNLRTITRIIRKHTFVSCVQSAVSRKSISRFVADVFQSLDSRSLREEALDSFQLPRKKGCQLGSAWCWNVASIDSHITQQYRASRKYPARGNQFNGAIHYVISNCTIKNTAFPLSSSLSFVSS